MLKLISFLPKLVDEAENRELFREVTKEELRVVISSFSKDKSPGPNGWTTEFFGDFFDVVGTDLLRVV
jgi:hypothetical protein